MRTATANWSRWPKPTALRGWAIEGTGGGYGAGLTRHLDQLGELVIELDRLVRPGRRAGAKSDLIDAECAARDAPARTQLAQPKTGPERDSLQILLTARRAVVAAASTAQRQLRALVITAPEPVRARFRGQTTREMLTTATRLRPSRTSTDVHTFTALSTLRALAPRTRALETEAAEHERAIRAIVRAWHPELLELTGVGPINAATVLTAWSHPGRCRNDAAFAMLAGAAPIPASSGKTVRYRLNRSVTGSSTGHCTTSRCPGCATTPTPAPMPTDAEPRARPTATSNAASSATSPAGSTASSNQAPQRLDEP
jgi:transposase